MRRPLLAVGISYGVATWASFFLGAPLIFSAVCVSLGLLAFLLRKNERALPVIFLTAAIAFAAHEVYDVRMIRPLHGNQGQDVLVQGVVTAVDMRRLPSYTLTVRASFPEEDLPDTILRIRGWGGLYFEPGDGISAQVRLEDLRGSQAFHNSRGVFIGARLIEAEAFDQLSLFDRFEGFFLRRRATAAENIAHNISPRNAALISGMALGDISEMDPALSTALSRSGLIHMMVVSGMHLSILVGLLDGLLKRLRAPPRLGGLAGAAGAFGFAFLVGLSPSIVRALIMMLVYIAAGMISRKSDSLNSLGLALLLICIFAPNWILDRGLWMSFTATAGIITCSGPIMRWLQGRFPVQGRVAGAVSKLFLGALAVTLSAYAFSLPVKVVTSGWVSLVSPIVHILTAPLVAPALVFGVMSATFTGPWMAPFAFIADICAGLIADISRIAASMPFATFPLSEFWMLLWLVLAGGMIIYLVRKKAGKELCRYALTLLVFAFAVGSITLGISNHDKVEVVAIEDSSPIVLIRDGRGVIVGTPTVFEFGRLARYLDYRGVRYLDAIIAYDSGNQITSALINLVEVYDAALIVGPDDDYILGQMRRALPDTEVLSGGYAAVDVLGGVVIIPCSASRQVQIRIGHVTLVKSGEEYAIIGGDDPNIVRIWQDGVMVWTSGAPPAFEPLGALIFGERRLVLSL